jgi:hypothetical protein
MLAPELAIGCATKCNTKIQGNFGCVVRQKTAFIAANQVPLQSPLQVSIDDMMYAVLVYEWGQSSGTTITRCLTNIDELQAVKQNSRIHYDLVNNESFGVTFSVEHGTSSVQAS